MSTLLAPSALAELARLATRVMPDRCDVLRLSGGTDVSAGALSSAQTVASRVPCAISAGPREVYPFGLLPNQPVSEFSLSLPIGTAVQSNDILSLDSGQRLYVVLFVTSPHSYQTAVRVHVVLSATAGVLADAYLRPNATVSSMRDLAGLYTERRVCLSFPAQTPQAPLERLRGGIATLTIGLFDLPDADWAQGDGVTILSMDGVSLLPQLATFTLNGSLRRPLPYAVLEADCIADV